MFKSIHYNICIFTLLLTVAVAGTAVAAVYGLYVVACPGTFAAAACLWRLKRAYGRYGKNISFLLNALENGDSSFSFPETGLHSRDRVMNAMMNRIREILAAARVETIEKENFLGIILESVSTGIIIIDDRGIVRKASRAALDMLGLPFLLHVNHLHAIDDSYPELFLSLRHGDRLQISLSTEREELQVSLNVSQISLKQGMMRIITMNSIGGELEMKETESWIRLIRVMTHEIMNSVAPIASLSETMSLMYRSGDEAEKLWQNTLDAFETIRDTASGMLNFVESYRRFTSVPKPEMQNFDLYALAEKVVRLHESVLEEKGVITELRIPKPFVMTADENLIMQVIINLLKNAVEAIEAGSGGRITVSAQRGGNGRTVIDVSNSGVPIASDVLPHIFIPFFTTRQTGSGVGLSVSRYIMRLHGGALHHLPATDGLTTFRIIMDGSARYCDPVKDAHADRF